MYWQLLYSFFKIGLFAFGGGYAMIPLIQAEIVGHRWLTAQEFANVVAISQMTPGPIAVNSATFVGYRIMGLGGALVATIGVILPSFLLTLLVARFVFANQNHPIVKGLFAGIRPAVVALITSAAIFLLPSSITSIYQGLLAVITLLVVIRTRINPLTLIFLGGVVGMVTRII